MRQRVRSAVMVHRVKVHKVRKVILKKNEVVHITMADKTAHAAVVHPKPNEVKVLPVSKDQSWWDWFSGNFS
jgi:hypothetical protein